MSCRIRANTDYQHGRPTSEYSFANSGARRIDFPVPSGLADVDLPDWDAAAWELRQLIGVALL
jgi:hypothetical protein